MTFSWVKCPICGEVTDLTRMGPVGVKGIPDSRTIKCGSCGREFNTKGETIWEALGRNK